MEEFIFQFKSNTVVRYMVLGAFLMISYIVSGGSLFTTLVAILGLVLGRLS